ncbi:MAG: CPBP family intramembrane metalloprotease [Candidatus Lokiarchaeota archaeon]|nr:CPBP family intramembrane metalloprotease [Candidatus Lokiarchaeota archaeon]
MVMDDPDRLEMEEADSSIGIFEPGTWLERDIDWDRMFKILLKTGAAFALGMAVTAVTTLIAIVTGLITISSSLSIIFEPWAFIFISIGQFGFIIIPIRYVKNKGLHLGAIGIKAKKPAIEIGIGIIAGIGMLALSIILTLITVETTGEPLYQDQMLIAHDPLELVGWAVCMIFVIGVTEEILFRGFLQRRFEIYFSSSKEKYKDWAVVVTSLIFAVLHLDILGVPTRFLLGVILGLLAQWRNYSLVSPIIAHGINNFGLVFWNTYYLLPF